MERQMRVKEAVSISDVDGDTSFEEAMSNLAHAYIKTHAPSLLDNELGFQMLKRDEDGEKAHGVLACKVGRHLVYVPVFFDKGRLNGHEILYLPKQNLCLPNDESWVQHLKSKHADMLGESITRDTGKLGIRQPDFSVFKQQKRAAWLQPEFEEFLPLYASVRSPEHLTARCKIASELFQAVVDVPGLLKRSSTRTLRGLTRVLTSSVPTAHRFDELFGLDMIAAAYKEAAARERRDALDMLPAQPRISGCILDAMQHDEARVKAAMMRSKVRIYYLNAVMGEPDTHELSDADREQLARDQVLVQDTRDDDEVSIPYQVRVEDKLFNPTQSGLYQVIMKDGLPQQCFIAMHPSNESGTGPRCLVVATEGEDRGDYLTSDPAEVWCSDGPLYTEFDDWFEGLEVAKLPGSGKRVFILPNGNATQPVSVGPSIGDEYQASYGSWDCCGHSGRIRQSPYGSTFMTDCECLCLPATARQLTISPGWPGLELGTPETAKRTLRKKLAELKLFVRGDDLLINDTNAQSKMAGLASLVRDHGFREPVARRLIQEAEKCAHTHRVYRVQVKYAMGAPFLTGGGPMSPPVPWEPPTGGNVLPFNGNTQRSHEISMPVDDMRGDSMRSLVDSPEAWSPFDRNRVADSAINKEPEEFSTTLFSALLRNTDDDAVLEEVKPKLLAGVNGLGQLLLSVYANGEQYADRYGKNEIPSLQSSLRNAFKQLGEVVIWLENKTVSASPLDELRAPNLSESTGE
jgi:hypothetical protein